MTKEKKPREPLKRCPSKQHIMAIQAQLFDNGPKPGKGRSQHSIKLEVYCEGRLDLCKPYWSRVVQLIEPKLFMAWVDREHGTGTITDVQRETYESARETVETIAKGEGIEFAKMGHIGAARENKYYAGQFVTMVKESNGPLHLFVFLDGEMIEVTSFLYDKFWKPGGSRRKFFGFYDPCGMYAAMQAERAQRAEADARANLGGTMGGNPWE